MKYTNLKDEPAASDMGRYQDPSAAQHEPEILKGIPDSCPMSSWVIKGIVRQDRTGTIGSKRKLNHF